MEHIYGSVALLLHNTLKWSAILGLSFLHGAGGPGNPCYGTMGFCTLTTPSKLKNQFGKYNY